MFRKLVACLLLIPATILWSACDPNNPPTNIDLYVVLSPELVAKIEANPNFPEGEEVDAYLDLVEDSLGVVMASSDDLINKINFRVVASGVGATTDATLKDRAEVVEQDCTSVSPPFSCEPQANVASAAYWHYLGGDTASVVDPSDPNATRRVNQERFDNAADIVVYIGDSDVWGQTGGAGTPAAVGEATADPELAYVVVSDDIALTWGLAHEIGHIFGVYHQTDPDSLAPAIQGYIPGTYNYPFLSEDRTVGTIMNSGLGCDVNAKPFANPPQPACTRLERFSSPTALDENGNPLGSNEADAVRTLDENREPVSDFSNQIPDPQTIVPPPSPDITVISDGCNGQSARFLASWLHSGPDPAFHYRREVWVNGYLVDEGLGYDHCILYDDYFEGDYVVVSATVTTITGTSPPGTATWIADCENLPTR